MGLFSAVFLLWEMPNQIASQLNSVAKMLCCANTEMCQQGIELFNVGEEWLAIKEFQLSSHKIVQTTSDHR